MKVFRNYEEFIKVLVEVASTTCADIIEEVYKLTKFTTK